LLGLHRQYATIRQEVTEAIERVCASQQFILGEEVEALESEIARFTGTSAAVGCASGTDALWLALTAAGIGFGDAVITTPFSFFASASAIVRVGARPIFVDVDHRTLNLDPAKVEARLRSSPNSGIKAILPVHLYGQCADMTALRRISEEFHLHMVEDAAQALGAAWQNKPAGAIGLAAAFSFYPTKNLSAYGQAGMVTTSNMEMADHMRRLRNHGSLRRYHHEEFGWNARMDAIQAAILRVKLPHLETWNQQRRDRAATYDRLFAEAGLTSSSGSKQTTVQPLEISKQGVHVFHQYVIRATRRDELRAFLAQKNIGSEVYYPVPLHLQPCFAYLGYREGDLPVAEGAANEVLALPMFPELTEDEQRCVVSNVADFYS
jgi:dTDP-4-amino-4,6-dideoxygalactose transaminase